jgi:hypothetical protein
MRATLLPLKGGPHDPAMPVTLVNRTSRDRITVQRPDGQFRAVDRFRLRTEDGRRKFDAEEFNRLPWRGTGKDPLTLSTGNLFDNEVRA